MVYLEKFWLIIEPVLCAQVIEQVDTVLSDNCPSFLDSLRLTTFTLGTKPPRIDAVKTFRNTERDIVVREMFYCTMYTLGHLAKTLALDYGLEGVVHTQ